MKLKDSEMDFIFVTEAETDLYKMFQFLFRMEDLYNKELNTDEGIGHFCNIHLKNEPSVDFSSRLNLFLPLVEWVNHVADGQNVRNIRLYLCSRDEYNFYGFWEEKSYGEDYIKDKIISVAEHITRSIANKV